jgi:uncharacterized protein (DUF488 family)
VGIMSTMAEQPVRIYSVGHSNRSLEELLDLLREFGIRTLVDIRRFPGSRRLPHFGRENLAAAMNAQGVAYAWMEHLGGWRHSLPGSRSRNSGLENAGFRAYADYMASDEFRKAARELIMLASSASTAYMCAEALYWRCHRRLLSDYLVAKGLEVVHIMGRGKSAPHTMTRQALVTEDSDVIYPPPQS